MKRLTVLPWLLWAVIAAFAIAFIFHAGRASAEPLYKGANDGVVLTLYNEPCGLKEQVTNLPARITWEEKGKTYEGCFFVHPGGFVVAYFVWDKTVAIIPADIFVKVTGV